MDLKTPGPELWFCFILFFFFFIKEILIYFHWWHHFLCVFPPGFRCLTIGSVVQCQRRLKLCSVSSLTHSHRLWPTNLDLLVKSAAPWLADSWICRSCDSQSNPRKLSSSSLSVRRCVSAEPVDVCQVQPPVDLAFLQGWWCHSIIGFRLCCVHHFKTQQMMSDQRVLENQGPVF